MDELRDLYKVALLASSRYSVYNGQDFELPQLFKDNVKEINSNSIVYNRYSAIIETKGYQNGTLNIYMPNQWFFVASYFTDLYNELIKYKKYALQVTSKERLKILDGGKLTNEENHTVTGLNLSSESKRLLIRFMTDYSWWGGAKTIDRGDFYVSPILSHAKLVNASQSFVADLCAFLASKQDLVDVIINGISKKEVAFTKVLPLQRIFYGAPGTGKSNTIKKEVEDKGRLHFRTTFHPDSDYSTFVGCYKPTMVEAPVRDGSGHEVRDAKQEEKSRISYSFVPQAFTKAYCEAWNRLNDAEPVFLVIEEINRGNCAQIFGDIFQLLDRDETGKSEYPIDADEDLMKFLLHGTKADGTPWLTNKDGIKDGKLCLPANLHIWATMNTSDQSLFPIDSAFKRRWDWRYVPIDTEKEQWCIAVNGNKYSWSSFLKNINAEIQDTTSSEDKQLGFYFCKAQNNVISAEMFVSKVLFYIYNDVFKDYGFEREFFKHTEDNSKDPLITFRSFFDAKGSVDEKVVAELLENLRVKGVSDDNVQEEDLLPEFDEDGNNASISSKDYSKYAINGLGSYSKGSVAYEAMKIYIAKNPSKNVEEIVNDWMSLNVNVPNFVETQDMFENRKRSSRDSRIKDKVKEVLVKEGQRLYVSNQYNPERIKEFISKINKSGWDINISKIS